MTDLPYGRGGSPFTVIQRGHKITKISAFRCVGTLDSGPIYMKRPLSLEGSASEIFIIRFTGVVGAMISEIVDKQPVPEPQHGKPIVFSRHYT